MSKKFGGLLTKIFPYWCNYCPKRYRTEKSFHKHFLVCEARKAYEERKEKALAAVAPKNRSERRRMAKKAGAIKDWKELNAP